MIDSDETDERANLIPDNTNSKLVMDTDFQQIVVKWENINFSVTDNEKTTQILDNLSGFANPGEILAIMGGSGAGKTSFLSVLSNSLVMQDNFEIGGEVKLNDQNILSVNHNFFVRFVPQESILFEFMTPYEYLKFNLTLRSRLSEEEVIKRVNDVLEVLKLTKVAHNLIGGAIIRGLSGGEKKRVCIANELIMCPAVVILDEPTSGLDSFIANHIVRLLKDVSKRGVTIIFTIHQPSKSMFEEFNRLILMQEGRFVYQGKTKDSVKYFSSIGFNVQKDINPPDYYMKILKIDNRNHLTEKEEKTIRVLREGYKALTTTLWDDITLSPNDQLTPPDFLVTPTLLKSTKLLFWREKINYSRNPLAIRFKILHTIVLSILCALMFYNLGYDSHGIDDRRGVIIFILFNSSSPSAYSLSMSVAVERKLILKDISNSLYNVASYLTTKIIFELPLLLITGIIRVFSIYYLVNLNDKNFGKPAILACASMSQYLIGMGLGIFAGSLADSTVLAYAFASTINIGMLVLSGFINDPDTGPDCLSWTKYVTPYYYLRNAALKNEFDDLDYDDVRPEPEDRFNYKGEIIINLLIPFIHFGVFCILAHCMYRYQIHKISLGYR